MNVTRNRFGYYFGEGCFRANERGSGLFVFLTI